MIARCPSCNNRFLRHNQKITCTICFHDYHLRCVSPNENIVNESRKNWFCLRCSTAVFPFNGIEDNNEFNHAINDCLMSRWNGDIFNPFEINDDVNNFEDIQDADPDIQYYNNELCINNIISCNYHLEDTFNSELEERCITNECFSLIHFNVRSMLKNFDEFYIYLINLNHSFSVIGLCETWLTNVNADYCNIPNYVSEHKFRSNRNGGGVSLFIRENIRYKLRNDVSVLNDIIECLFIELHDNAHSERKSTIVGIVYRPPNCNLEEFNGLFNDIISKIRQEGKYFYIMGDFNINLLNVDQHLHTREFLDNMFSSTLIPVITKPTRITDTSATLIDHIYCNQIDNAKLFTGILHTRITDHFPVFLINHGILKSEHSTLIRKRTFNETNTRNFQNIMNNISWENVLNNDNAQEAYTNFHNSFQDAFERSFPYRSIKLGYKNRKSWLTHALKVSIKHKNRLYFMSKKYPTLENSENYKQYKKILNKLLKETEKQHYDNLFSANKKNIKKSWSVIKEIINKKSSNSQPDKLEVNNQTTSDTKQIVAKFNQYFTNIGPTLASKIPSSNCDPLTYIKHSNPKSIYLTNVNTKEVETLIKNLKTHSTPGWDEVPSSLLKNTYHSFIGPLTHALNLSLSQGIFPDELKLARVTPVYKSDNPQKVNNYRPISVLSVFSKLFEKIMYTRLMTFFEKHKLLYKLQFGFRANYSTDLALTYLIDTINKAIDSKEYAIGIFIDLSKAFDTVDHNILLSKLFKYGIRGVAYDWFKSYLNCRKQYIKLNTNQSCSLPITCGVPQGSILGPLLFLIYINDLPNASGILTPIIFADDTNFFASGKNLDDLIDIANFELKEVIQWMRSNKLSLNIQKTKYIIFCTKNKSTNSNNSIKIHNEPISRVKIIKFLGVILDSTLRWDKHINYIKGKISRGIGIMNRAKKLLNRSTLITLYYSFIFPHINYCINVWGSTFDMYLSTILKLQKRAIRIIKHVDKRAHSGPLFTELKILDVYKLYIFNVGTFMFNFMKRRLPCIFDEFYIFSHNANNYNTRQYNKLRSPLFHTSSGQRSLRYNGVKCWNNFAHKFSSNCSYHCYKMNLKNSILSNQFKF